MYRTDPLDIRLLSFTVSPSFLTRPRCPALLMTMFLTPVHLFSPGSPLPCAAQFFSAHPNFPTLRCFHTVICFNP